METTITHPAEPHATTTSEAVFEALANAEAGRVFGIAYAILRDHGEAEDAVQEALYKAWKAWGNAPPPERRRAWFTQICVNHCIARRRFLTLRGFRTHAGEAELGRHPVTETGFESRGIDIDRALARLSRRQRAALVLHHRLGYSVNECAEFMGLQ